MLGFAKENNSDTIGVRMGSLVHLEQFLASFSPTYVRGICKSEMDTFESSSHNRGTSSKSTLF